MTATAQQRADIIEAVTRLFWFIDIRDWDAFPGVFADVVTLDYSSVWGGEPATVNPGQIRADWEKLIGAFDATQHLLGNHLVTVDGDRAEVTAVFQAVHLLANPLGSPRWTLGGTYRIGLRLVAGVEGRGHGDVRAVGRRQQGHHEPGVGRAAADRRVAAARRGIGEGCTSLPFQHISQWGACGKAPVVAHNRWPRAAACADGARAAAGDRLGGRCGADV
ncbi:nuclear transport factor 2 family protein [Nocardia sp. NPDC056611]|uniref:nuclear transport factor 2 family protein n=1 Tax=Nocardia sp. NPDC056611 TaxID=3345877 RepID=UPI003671BABF